MILNYIWIALFAIAFIFTVLQALFFGDYTLFSAVVDKIFEMSKTGFEISLMLTGIMAFWLGLMKIGEKAGLIKIINKLAGPFFQRLFPEIPKDHPVLTPILLNFSANMLGLDNAATPLGLKAMEGMQELNPNKDTASNAQIMFLVLNTSGLTILPVSILAYRMQMGAANPADVFIPILLTTFMSTLGGLIAVSIYQKINLFDKVILSYLGGLVLFIISLLFYFSTLSPEKLTMISKVASNAIILSIIFTFIIYGFFKKVNVYEAFIEGAKESFDIAITIIPYLIAMLVAIGAFRASGAMDFFINQLTHALNYLGVNADFLPALPTALMKPLSGSGARGLMVEAMEHYGADSFVGRLTSVMQGSTETTLYVIALYFGAVNIRKTRYAITCGLIADFIGIISAIVISYLFFHQI
ncbi:nucleoside recognition domain-containing protein [Persicobacter psychrovividus]|uniref:Membrane protein n=1 Tax=Persicobacter psychrovividus TaxID=387638 RepID=A0ABM7VDG0_9BACT|nr:membrane protein [Persicobacter psychrovividus]